MKYYYYLLFRLFNSLSDPKKKNDAQTINYLTTSTSTLIIYFIFYTSLVYIDFYFVPFLNNIITGKFSIIIIMVTIGFLNYWFFIKPKKFLTYGFEADKKGGFAIIGFIILFALCFIFIANKNRENIFKERKKIELRIKNNPDRSDMK